MSLVNRAVRPYFDDFDPNKRYYDVLFRPSYAVQTRELNQIQSMFEQQLTYFGNNIFKNGSIVIPGALNYDNQYQYVKVTINNYSSVIDKIKTGTGLRLITQDDDVIANVLQFVDIDGSDPATFYVRYVNSGATKIVSQFVIGKVANLVDLSDNLVATVNITAVGMGTKASVDAGVYYAQGRFVLVTAQTVLVSKYTSTPTASIGFNYNEVIITENDDSSLVDNASGSPNFTAPGAHRLRIDLTLTSYDTSSGTASLPKDYIELMKMDAGIVQQLARGPEYNVLGQTLAQRTYEESGDYSVKPFAIDVTEDLLVPGSGIDGSKTAAQGGDESKYDVTIDPGLAYVRGYRVELLKSITKIVDKARDTDVSNNSPAIVNYGSYVIVKNTSGWPIGANFQEIDFYDTAIVTPGTASGSKVGSAYVRSIVNGSTVNIYIFDVKNASGVADTSFISSAKSVYSSSGSSVFTADLSYSSIFDTGSTGAIVPLNYSYVKTLLDENGNTDTNYTVTRKFSATADASGNVFLSCGANESFIDFNNAYSLVIDNTSHAQIYVNSATIGGTPTGSSMTLALGAGEASKAVTAIVQVKKQQATQKNKTVAAGTTSGTADANSSISLGKVDVFELVSVTDSASNDVTDQFTLVKNATMDYYGISYIVAKNSGISYPVSIRFNYYQRGTGDYFSVDSYSLVDYNSIPSISGYRLADCLDFRPDLNTSGVPVAGTDVVHQSSLVNSDITYYLPRIDKVYVTSDGTFDVVKGTSSLNPTEPATPENSMELATITLGAYTANANILTKNVIPNKRYTMADIGTLESRIENLEYYVSLSMLEQQTANSDIYDDAGNDRFKNGFIVDAFQDHSVGDWTWSEYHCSVGPMGSAPNALRPEYSINAIDVSFNSTDSSNVVVKDGLVFLDYTEVDYISQPQGSSTANVNPYAVYKWDGAIDLSPSVDNWIDVVYNPPKVNYTVIQNGNLQQSWQALGLAWNSGSSSYTTQSVSSSSKVVGSTIVAQQQQLVWTQSLGRDQDTTPGSYSLVTPTTYKGLYNGNPAILQDVKNTVQTTSTITLTTTNTNTTVDEIGDYLLSQSAIPYIRSKDVVVSIKGMKPSTKMFFFFDNVQVDQYVKPDDSSDAQYGDDVVTDDTGSATAIFTIPDDATQKFRIGTRVLDVTDSSSNDALNAQSYGSATYTAQGVLETRQLEYNATRAVNTSSSSISSTSTTTNVQTNLVKYYDPLAESFLITDDGGAFVTAIDLYFAQKDSDISITVEIHGMDNGFPTQDIIPGSSVTLDPSQVNVSSDGSIATTFTFPYPVSLKQGTEYCFVIHSNSDQYYIWKATMGETDIISGSVISKQPFIGVMFKSQNSSTWTEDQLSDLKFAMRRASFNVSTNGVIILENEEQADVPLVANPIFTYDSETYFDVVMPDGHNFIAGGSIVLSGLTGGNGFVDTDLNGTHIISSIQSPRSIRINTSVTATADGQIGGDSGTRSNTVQYSMINPSITDVTFDSTSIEYEFKGIGGKSFSGSETPYDVSIDYQQISNDTLNFLSRPYMVLTNAEETSKLSGNKSFTMRITLESTKENVSPVIDLQQSVIVTPMFLIDNNSTDDADGSNIYAKYRTIPISIDNPTVALQLYTDEYVPNNAKILYSVRTANSSSELANADWSIIHTSTSSVSPYYIAMSQLTEESSDFTWLQLMIQLKSDSVADIPQVRDMRLIALGT